jgi:protoporphyrinogen oxidase
MKDDSGGPARRGQPQRFAVIGGGMLGLTLAHRLAGQGRDVTLIEGAPHLGGLASAWSLGDITWDRHYHVILASDGHLRRVLAEIGLDSEIEWTTTRTGVLANGRLHSLSNTIEMATFPVLNVVDKARLAATIMGASRIKDGTHLERIPLSDWLIRWSGQRTFDRFWLPLLRSKLGENYRETSAAFIWATIRRLYAARRSGLKEERFGYVRGGYAGILERLGQTLENEGVHIQLGRPVARVSVIRGRPVVSFADGTSQPFDRVVVTAAAPLAARLCEGLSADDHDRLAGVRYQGIVCASVLLTRPLGGFYVTNLLDPAPFTGVIEMSALVDRDRFLGGHHLVYLPRYVASDDPFLKVPDAEIRASFLRALTGMYPDLVPAHVLAFQVSRVPYVMALPTLNYSDRIPPVRTSLPGVFTVNSAHIVNGTLNVNETVQLAERAAIAFDGEWVGNSLPSLDGQ